MVTQLIKRWLPQFFFSLSEKNKLRKAIQAAELLTSAEIRLRVEPRVPRMKILEQAQKNFESMGMHRTEQKNAVLIFICPRKKEFAIIGDSGIHEKVGQVFWKELTDKLAFDFSREHAAQGLITVIARIGQQLKTYFPRSEKDKNELPDKIST